MIEILKCYETVKIYETVNRDDIQKLELDYKLIPKELSGLRDKLPPVLMVRSSLLNKIPNVDK